MPTVVATDNFNRADGGLGANWTATLDGFGGTTVMQIVSNRATGNNGGDSPRSFWSANAFANDQYSKATISATGNGFVFVGTRLAGDGSTAMTGYVFAVRQSDGSWLLAALGSGTLDSGLNTFADGDVIEIQCEGTTIRCLRNGSNVTSVTDSSYSSGAAGIGAQNDTVFLDTWEGGNLAAGGRIFKLAGYGGGLVGEARGLVG